MRLASCHSRVDDPDWICDEDSGAAGDSSCDHRLDRCELFRGARATHCCTFEEGTGPLIPWARTLLAGDTEAKRPDT